MSSRSGHVDLRPSVADSVIDSVCPSSTVGCGQKVFVKDDKPTEIECDPAGPISRGRLCPQEAGACSW